MAEEFTEREIQFILDLLDRSEFDSIAVEVGELKVVATKTGSVISGPVSLSAESLERSLGSHEPRLFESPTDVGPSERPDAEPSAPSTAVQRSLVPIKAPLAGVFYAQSEPDAPPFVVPGTKVSPDTTVGIVEVMKLFNTVRAGVAGEVVEVVARSGEFVEYGAVLLFVDPVLETASGPVDAGNSVERAV